MYTMLYMVYNGILTWIEGCAAAVGVCSTHEFA